MRTDFFQTKKRAFTLIELLVVIAIIALLLSIIVPSLKKAKEYARSTICMSNLHQWGLIWKIYGEENNGMFSSGNEGTVNTPRGKWIYPIRMQLDSREKILLCPSAAKLDPGQDQSASNLNLHGSVNYAYRATIYTTSDASTASDSSKGEACSYGFNCWLHNYPNGFTVDGMDVSKDSFRRFGAAGSSRIPLMADSLWRGGYPAYQSTRCFNAPDFNGQWGNNTQADNFSHDNGDPGYEIRHFAMDRHRGGTNVVFLDLSAEKVGIKKIWELKWHRTFNTGGYRANAGGSPWPAWMQNYPNP